MDIPTLLHEPVLKLLYRVPREGVSKPIADLAAINHGHPPYHCTNIRSGNAEAFQ
jgi:hypothetical protein